MSLNWSISEIKNYKQVCFQSHIGTKEEMEAMIEEVSFVGPSWEWKEESDKTEITRIHPRTHVLILASMSIGMGEITEKSWQDFYTRIYAIEKVYGAFLNQDGKPCYFTADDIRSHNGLRINVAEESRASFEKRLTKGLREDAMREVRKAITA